MRSFHGDSSTCSGLLANGEAEVGQDTFKRPLFPGDTMKFQVEVTESRPTSRGDRGIVSFRHRVMNQHGEEVMECTVKRMLRGRNFKN